MTTLKDRWDALTPTTRKRLTLAGFVVGLLAVAGIVSLASGKRTRPPPPKADKVDVEVMLPRPSVSLEDLKAEILAMEKRFSRLEAGQEAADGKVRKAVDDLASQLKTDGADERLARMEMRVEALSQNQNEPGFRRGGRVQPPPAQPAKPASPTEPPKAAPTPAPVAPPMPSAPAPSAAPKGPAIRFVSGGLEEVEPGEGAKADGKPGAKPVAKTAKAGPSDTHGGSGDAKRPAGKEEMFSLPSGAMIQGVLLNGLDAPTSGHAQKNPTPVLIRVKHEAILPNRFRMDIKECFVIASGYGEMSTERAYLRTEVLSCVRNDGKTLEARMDGYVVGEDGKVGMRGRLVSKQGAVIAKSMMAGFLSGFAETIKPTSVPSLNLNLSGTTETQTYDWGAIGQNSVLSGTSNALTEISKFYLDMAKEMFPVVEIDAGRPAHIIAIKGMSLRMQPGQSQQNRRGSNANNRYSTGTSHDTSTSVLSDYFGTSSGSSTVSR